MRVRALSQGHALARQRNDEAGSGTILTVAVVMVACLIAAVTLVWSSVAVHRTRLQAVTDLAALAGADISATAQWEDVGSRPCRAATEVVDRNGAVVESCWVDGVDTLVEATQSLHVLGFEIAVSAHARAGVDP